MPITLAEAKQLTQDKLTQFVIDEFRKSALLDMLPFDNTVLPPGNGQTMTYAYNRVTTLPSAGGRAINSEYQAQEAKTTQYNVNLKPFGGSFQLDRVIIQHEKKVVDHIQFQTQQKIKATVAVFHDWLINGDSGVDPLQFDGLEKAVAGSSTELIPGAAINLSTSANITANWQAFLDAMRKLRSMLDGAPTLWLMNADMFGVFQSVMDRAGINLASKQNYGDEAVQWGPSLVMSLGDKPNTATPIIATANGETSIFTVRLGLDAVHAASPEGNKVAEVYLPDLKAPGAVKTGEVEMVAAVAVKATRSAGVLRKVKIA
jgi:hypothetical protein